MTVETGMSLAGRKRQTVQTAVARKPRDAWVNFDRH